MRREGGASRHLYSRREKTRISVITGSSALLEGVNPEAFIADKAYDADPKFHPLQVGDRPG
jgi:hypothetical protein